MAEGFESPPPMAEQFEWLIQENERMREAINHAIRLLGPGDDEDSDSPGNMAFAVLMAAGLRTQEPS